MILFSSPPHPSDLHPFPTRRSSDLSLGYTAHLWRHARERAADVIRRALPRIDRKSTRLNSSHANISYAVFCLKKKISLKRRRRANYAYTTSHITSSSRLNVPRCRAE